MVMRLNYMALKYLIYLWYLWPIVNVLVLFTPIKPPAVVIHVMIKTIVDIIHVHSCLILNTLD